MNTFLESAAQGTAIPAVLVLPFAMLLLAIAILPLAAAHFWEKNRSKAIVAALISAPVVFWCVRSGLKHELVHALKEYAGFIIMLGALFVVAGGIYVDGDLHARPRTNAAFLLLGAVLANLIGTTGASMTLIRPLLRANRQRRHIVHTVVFFIFMVCNTGGLLTPLGDPPLYLGYVRGVPFTWTLRLWPYWAAVNGALLALYLLTDLIMARREDPAVWKKDDRQATPLHVRGGINFLLLGAVVFAVARLDTPYREAAMVLAALLSLALTRKETRTLNGFSWGPIEEVAILFLGIFVTMTPALLYLEANARALGIEAPFGFFWATGSLSSFLDNAPTYLTFVSVSQGLGRTAPEMVAFAGGPAIPAIHLTAISLGAVLMGANTYIGNGPNFMVKAIAEGSGVKMPGFFGYMAYSLGILVPLFAVLSWIVFVRG